MPTILLVEDEPAVRRVLRQMLWNLGHEVIEAGGAPEALDLAAACDSPIDVLITDVVMPQTNCEDFVNELVAARPQVKVIYISGYAEEMLARYGVKQIQSNFLQKPFRVEELAAKIAEVLGTPRARGAGA
jgi:DNA-binding NtrC family response regulator